MIKSNVFYSLITLITLTCIWFLFQIDSCRFSKCTEVFYDEEARKLIERLGIGIPLGATEYYIFNERYGFDRRTYIGMTLSLDEFKKYIKTIIEPFDGEYSKYSYDDFSLGFPSHWEKNIDSIGPQKYGEKYRTPLWDPKAMKDPVYFIGFKLIVFDRKSERLLIYEVEF